MTSEDQQAIREAQAARKQTQARIDQRIKRELNRELSHVYAVLAREFGYASMRNADLREIHEAVHGCLLLGAEISEQENSRERAREQHQASVNMIRAAFAVARMREEGTER